MGSVKRKPGERGAAAAARVVRRFVADDAATKRDFASLLGLEQVDGRVAIHDADRIGRSALRARTWWSFAGYEATGAAWKIGPRRDCADYAFAVVRGVVVEVCALGAWQPAGRSHYVTRAKAEVNRPGRWEFIGDVAPPSVREKYRWHSVSDHFKRGNQNPIHYVNCP
jgi:hypothetical protein